MSNAEDRIKAIISAIANIEKRVDAIVKDPSVKVYRDEPIVTTAAKAAEDLPEKYREMKRIAAAEFGVTLGEWALFYKQGKFMEDYCDSYDKNVPFLRYYPTYRQMNDRQLRTYFTWRTAVRNGEVKDTYLSYVYVYLYELINLIGCRDAEDGLEKLLAFTEEYSKIDSSIKRYAVRWARDMRIYYGIPCEKKENDPDGAAAVLSAPRLHGEEDLFDAICTLSTFDPLRSKLYKTHPENTRALICRTYTAFSDYCDKARKQTLAERLFGKECAVPYDMFPSAVFFDSRKGDDREYEESARRKFTYKNRRWYLTGYPVTEKKSSLLGSLIKTIDSHLRPYFGMEQTKPGKTAATLGAIVGKVTEEYFRELREAEARKIEFDFSKLGSIRTLSEITKEKLVSEEETDLPAGEALSIPAESLPKEDGCALLTEAEKEILRAVIERRDAAALARERGVMLSAAVDSINEKLFETFFDTAIEFDGETPVAVDDYVEDLKGYC